MLGRSLPQPILRQHPLRINCKYQPLAYLLLSFALATAVEDCSLTHSIAGGPPSAPRNLPRGNQRVLLSRSVDFEDPHSLLVRKEGLFEAVSILLAHKSDSNSFGSFLAPIRALVYENTPRKWLERLFKWTLGYTDWKHAYTSFYRHNGCCCSLTKFEMRSVVFTFDANF